MACVNTVDYSLVPADPRVPFLFELDEEASLLYPEADENQRFCYLITGVGENNSGFADLSHFVLSVCPDLTLEDILSATVVIDGVPQNVVLGDNVTIMPPDHPDPPTGCPGLKVDFGLDKVGGEMFFCFTLRRPFAIGPVAVCVKGGQTELNNLAICGPVCGISGGCSTTVIQRATVCVPVTVTPHAIVGEITAQCCDPAVITPGRAECLGNPNQSCVFTISQDLCFSIPVTFGAEAVPGEARTQCFTPGTGACDCGETLR